MSVRLSLALESGAVAVPPEGRIGVFGATAGDDLSALPHDRVTVVQGFRPDVEALERQGYAVMPEAEGRFALSVVILPRSRDAARARIADAAARTDGPLLIDGAKGDGVDGILRELRKRADVGEALSKAHGKVFAVTGGDYADWMPGGPRDVAGGFVTRPGVFSADGPDRASILLAETLPRKLGPRVADLGAGWGYLARAILARDGVAEVHLIEADHAALACARENVPDPRARFHWADAAAFKPDAPFDTVVTNPPFHVSRAADPGLGRSFIEAAARMLAPRGVLWLVANRHLPYEKALRAAFREVAEHGDDPSFKVFCASHPIRSRRQESP
jgi:16S rRNA (guanine1207-N2)-methyltransferase